MRIGVFGGSFDPVHIGHLWIAEAALESLELAEIRWIPTAVSPLKPEGPVASDEHRLQMLRLAVSGCDEYVIDDREIRRGKLSYTVETVEELRAEHPETEIVIIIGSDSLATIPQWRDAERLLRLALPAVVQRGGWEEPDFSVLEGLVDQDRIDRIRHCVIPMPLIEVSSREMRARVAAGRSLRFRTPRAVESLIKAEGIYRPKLTGR
jgi:nicotinate-nucleotide adenylyltransferase